MWHSSELNLRPIKRHLSILTVDLSSVASAKIHWHIEARTARAREHTRMTEQDERKWRELCNQALHENDPDKLLSIFLELDLAMEQEQRAARSGGQSDSTGGWLS